MVSDLLAFFTESPPPVKTNWKLAIFLNPILQTEEIFFISNLMRLTGLVPHTRHVPSMKDLTKIQQKIYDFIYNELLQDRPVPTAREVALRFKYRSHRAAEDHIKALIRKGWLICDGFVGGALSKRPVVSLR